ncbi:MAG: AEC family transporter [Patescibacteria group bacterium]|jgi:hypothetical protein
MEIFFTVLLKLIPLYVIIILGYIGGRFLDIKKETIAPLLINIIVPVVIFTGIVTTKINLSTLSIPILFFLVSSSISLLTYYFSGFIWKDSTKNILSFAAGTANTGYFGLPVAIAIFGNSAIIIASLALLGTSLYTNSLGYFLAARGQHTFKESLIKVLKLPILHAFFIGLIVNLLDIKLGAIYFDMAKNFNGAFVILGMMIIGLGLADIKDFSYDFKFIGLSLFIKFLVWPLVMLTIILVDSYTFKIYDHNLYKLLILMAIVPVATNIVSYATILKAQPEKLSLVVFISTFFALFYVPLISALFLR